MSESLTEQQALLRDSLSRFLSDRYGAEARRSILASEQGWSAEIWRALAEDLGILGAAFPESVGGLGGDATDIMVMMEELGRALVLEPVLETVVLGGGLLRRCPTPAALGVMRGVVEGKERLAFAYSEPQARYGWDNIETRLEEQQGQFALGGRKCVVFGGPAATHLIVSARTAGSVRDRTGVALVLLEAGAAGVSARNYRTIDGRVAADLAFDGVAVSPEAVLTLTGGAEIIEAVLDEAAAAVCAEASGVLDRLVSATAAYTKDRRQFGVPISSFQAVQHRLVDMFVKAQQATAMSEMAATRLAAGGEDASRAVAAAKAFVGEACQFVGHGAVQLHGAMGITDELDVSHHFKRAVAIQSQFGSTEFHLRRFERLARAPEIAA